MVKVVFVFLGESMPRKTIKISTALSVRAYRFIQPLPTWENNGAWGIRKLVMNMIKSIY